MVGESLEELLRESSLRHSHLCPRQILGVRIGLAGAAALGISPCGEDRRLLVIVESDGCFSDGVEVATSCSVGHRTLRVEDYGKIAATFVEIKTGQSVRVAPRLDARERALRFAAGEPRHYFAQLEAYQRMPDEDLLIIQEVCLAIPIQKIVSRAGVRTACSKCGEEIINEREVIRPEGVFCQACAGQGYYQPVNGSSSLTISYSQSTEIEA
jgi:formylmethanofuran dehydrogenase subunit E